MPLATLELNPAAAPVASVIILHGLGADGSDFLPVCRALDLDRVGPVRFVMPNAPQRPVTINNGVVMPAWYDIFSLDIGGVRPDDAVGVRPDDAVGVRREDEAGLRASAAEVARLIDAEVARGIPSQRIVLAGFSQGCAMTLLAGLRHPQRLAGLVGLSGYLPLLATTAVERHAANADVPVFIGHGEQDDVVVLDRGATARDTLRSLGHRVEWHTYPMAHSVCQEEVEDLNGWLLRLLG